MENKIATVRERDGDWLAQALRTQLELETTWQSLEGKEGYRMRSLSLEKEEERKEGEEGEEGGVRVVCLSDTHSMQSSIKFDIPDGNSSSH